MIIYLLPKKFRLPSYLIPDTVKKGKRFHSQSFDLIVYQSSVINHQSSKFAFIVSKKIYKSAVRRNQIKRWMREAARTIPPKTKKGYNIILIANQHGRKNSLGQIKIELGKALNKAGLLK